MTDQPDCRNYHPPYGCSNCEDFLGHASIDFTIDSQTFIFPSLTDVSEADATPVEIKIEPKLPPFQRGNVVFYVDVVLPPDGPNGEYGDAKIRASTQCGYSTALTLGPCEDTLKFDLVGIRKTSTNPLRKLKLVVKIEDGSVVKAEKEFEVKQGVDLIVPGQTEQNEETNLVWIPRNDDFDENNVSCSGHIINDLGMACSSYTQSIVEGDDDLRDATIRFYGNRPVLCSVTGSGFYVFRNTANGWRETSGWWANPGDVVNLKLEGHTLTVPCCDQCWPTLTVTITRDGICEDATDSSTIAVTDVQITQVDLPNGFFAVPDRAIYLATGSRTEQITSNQIDVHYRCMDEGCVPCECSGPTSRVELWVYASEPDPAGGDPIAVARPLATRTIPTPTHDPQVARLDVELGPEAQTWTTARYVVRLWSCCGYTEHEIPASPLIHSIDFCPRAHIPGGSFCPYTHWHKPILGTEAWNEWYGLTLMFQPRADLTTLTIEITGVKELNYPTSARLVTCNPLVWPVPGCHRIKWEGYGPGVTEPPMEPATIFPSTLARSPEHVVAEGEYPFRLDGQSVSSGLTQRHVISNIPVRVEYDMVNPEDRSCGDQ
jgi:hypothetical protein